MWIAEIEDDEHGSAIVYIRNKETGESYIHGIVDAEDAENEELNNEDELLAEANAEADALNAKHAG